MAVVFFKTRRLRGLTPHLGAFFSDRDLTWLVLSYTALVGRFGGDPHVVGRTVRLDQQPFTILGVAPQGFEGVYLGDALDVIPLNEQHLRKIVAEWIAHYNRGRPHASLGPGIPEPSGLTVSRAVDYQLPHGHQVKAKPILAGLHHEYRLEPIAA